MTLENSINNGEEASVASGVNFGIMYLLLMPYLAIGVVAFFWYRASKATAQKGQSNQ